MCTAPTCLVMQEQQWLWNATASLRRPLLFKSHSSVQVLSSIAPRIISAPPDQPFLPSLSRHCRNTKTPSPYLIYAYNIACAPSSHSPSHPQPIPWCVLSAAPAPHRETLCPADGLKSGSRSHRATNCGVQGGFFALRRSRNAKIFLGPSSIMLMNICRTRMAMVSIADP